MEISSKYTERMLKGFPNNLKFVNKVNDALHMLVNVGSKMLHDLNKTKSRKVDNLFIDKCDPALSTCAYYIKLLDINNMSSVNIDIPDSSDAVITDNEKDFMNNDITGFEFQEELTPSGIFPSGILGLSYGFDWDEPETYIVPSGSSYVYKYTDIDDIPELLDYSYIIQSYDTVGHDEYINIELEIAGSGIIPSDILPDDIVKVAYLENEPISDLTIIDINNLQDPHNSDSDGIVVNPNDYVLDGNRIVFSKERSDYNPSTLIEIGDGQLYTYPINYQPDLDFSSTFIVEYKYKQNNNPRYLTQDNKLHNLGKKSSPKASY